MECQLKNSVNEFNPLVSVVTPCYNDGVYLAETIQSVLAQTYLNIEMIVVDDGSVDQDSINAIEQLKQKFPKVQFYRIENGGPSKARNVAISKAKGKYILPLDADDLIGPNYIEKAVKVLEGHPEVGLVYCHAEFFGERQGPWDLPPFTIQAFAWDNLIFNAGVFRRSHWEQFGGYDETLIYGSEDYDFWLNFIEIGLVPIRLDETLFFYRIKKKSRSTAFLQSALDHKVETYAKIFKNHAGFFEDKIEHFFQMRFELEKKILLSEKDALWSRE